MKMMTNRATTEGEHVHDHVYVHVVVDRGGGGWFLRVWDGQVRGLLLAHEGGAGCWSINHWPQWFSDAPASLALIIVTV